MIILNTKFSEKERKVLDKYLGKDYIILNSIVNSCYILNMNGDYYYNDCFSHVNNESIKNYKYNKVIPIRVIKVYDYYLMETSKEKGHWYRGEQDENQNIKFDSYSENLELAIRSL